MDSPHIIRESKFSCLSKRYTMGILTCFGFIITFGSRCNMAMTKIYPQGDSRFDWSLDTESLIDSTFYWGYLLIQIPGGILASAYPASRIFGAAIICSSFLNLLTPSAMTLSPTAVIIVRLLQGLAEGVTFPACHGIWRSWAPPLERSRLATLAFSGSYAGVVLGIPLTGVLSYWLSWRAPFYFYGIFGIIWYLLWLRLTFETPAKHPSISSRELVYIEKSLGASVNVAMPKISSYPWRSFFSSMPVYAIIVANFCRSWNFYFIVLFKAEYLQHIFNLQIEETGFLGVLPHLLMTIIVPCGGLLADYFRKKGILSTTNVRKVFSCYGFGLEAICFIVVAYSKTGFTAAFALMFGVVCNGFAISGFNVNHLDIAPRYASILIGISNGIGTLAGLICPIVIDHITRGKRPENWTTVYLLGACIHLFGVIFYAIFASGQLQSWAEPGEEGKPEGKMTTSQTETQNSFPVGLQEHEFSSIEL